MRWLQGDFLVSSRTVLVKWNHEIMKCPWKPLRKDLIKVVWFRFSCEHFSYVQHDCPNANKRDNQVPVCPMCLKPVPSVKGEEDRSVSEHIDKDCKSDTRIYTNSCSFGKCKKRELVPFNCSSCKKNFCLKHRHFDVHECKGQIQLSQREVLAWVLAKSFNRLYVIKII